jgi:uncharacterized protein
MILMPPSADTVVDVRSLIKRPGATSSLDRVVPAPSDLSDDLVRLGPRVTVHALIDSVVEGLLVRGTVSVPAQVACSRCLVERPQDIEGAVAELFVAPDGGGRHDEIEAGYDIVDATIDIDTLIRDALADAVPVRPLCRPECAGLCPTCGVDRNFVEPGSTKHAVDGLRPTQDRVEPGSTTHAVDGLRPTQARAECDGHPDQHDLRWAALADLQLRDSH